MPSKGIICVLLIAIGLTFALKAGSERAIKYLDNKIIQRISQKPDMRWRLVPCLPDQCHN